MTAKRNPSGFLFGWLELKRYNTVMHRSNERGFTIMELIVAMVFLGIVLVSLSNLFIFIRQINRAANNYTVATQVAQQLTEQYRNTPYANIAVGTTDVTTTALSAYPSLLSPRSATTTVSYITTSGAASGTDVGLKKAEVSVSYTDRTGVKSVQFSTWISNMGLNR